MVSDAILVASHEADRAPGRAPDLQKIAAEMRWITPDVGVDVAWTHVAALKAGASRLPPRTPSIMLRGWTRYRPLRGATARRRAAASVLPRWRFPEDHAGLPGPMSAQRFIWTGSRLASYRVTTCFGRGLVRFRSESEQEPRPPLAGTAAAGDGQALGSATSPRVAMVDVPRRLAC